MKQSNDTFENGEPVLSGEIHTLLINYSHIAEDVIEKHIRAVQDQATLIAKAHYIDQRHLLDVSIVSHPHYRTVCQKLRAGGRLLELGSSLGQNRRQLTHEGVSSSNLQGLDRSMGLSELGFDLFRDDDRFRGMFLTGDVLQGAIPGLDGGSFDFIYAAHFFGQFPVDDQTKILGRTLRYLKAEHGSCLFGSQIAIQQNSMDADNTQDAHSHNEDSFRRMVSTVASVGALHLVVETKMERLPCLDETVPDVHVLHFALRFE